MEGEEKSRVQILEEQVGKLQKENESLSKEKAMYESWWREADAKNAEVVESMKAIITIANMTAKQIMK